MIPLQGGTNELGQDDCIGDEVQYSPSSKRTNQKRSEAMGS